MARAFNKKVRLREFSLSDLVLRKVFHIAPDSKGKFAYKYDRPIIVKAVFDGGTIILNDMDRNENVLPVNANALKKYYSWQVFIILLLFDACTLSAPPFWLTIPNNNISNGPNHDLSRNIENDSTEQENHYSSSS
ncbi:hypothetical protein CRG98_028589 [Punica granatum]|uniref:Uncharacterized protein n=1 Tax=Punica granatum TaxID=22663 RepID=A0A2I0J455_PUNGR|nr:hypothetical protein CRG98_028589 [Punica granatum]